jgi:hypothetical protein
LSHLFCAVHASSPAVGVCTRCGAFGCRQCLRTDSTQCAACDERRPLPFRGPFALRSSIALGVRALLSTSPVLLVAAIGLFVLRVVAIQTLVVASRHWPLLDNRLTWMVGAPLLTELILYVGFASVVFEVVEARLSGDPRDLGRWWKSLPRAAAGAMPFLSFMLLALLFSARVVWHRGTCVQFWGPAGLSPVEQLVSEVWLAPWFALSLVAMGVARTPGLRLWRATAAALRAAPVRLILLAAVFRFSIHILVQEAQLRWLVWTGDAFVDWMPPTPKMQIGPGAWLQLLLTGVAAGVYCVAEKQLRNGMALASHSSGARR